MRKEILIPFCPKTNDLLSQPMFPNDPMRTVWRKNFEFSEQMQLYGWHDFKSILTGQYFPSFQCDVYDIIKAGKFEKDAIVTGCWTSQKRGKKYGIRLVI